MSATHCYRCGQEIEASNETSEHIILNAIGGILRSSRVWCAGCKDDYGSAIDAALAKDLLFLSNAFDVRRDRGVPPALEGKSASGEKVRVLSGGKPQYIKPEIEVSPHAASIRITANGREQLREVLIGLKRRYPQLDVETILKNAPAPEPSYISTPVQLGLKLGGDLSFRALAKTALHFHVAKIGIPRVASEVGNYIKDGATQFPRVWFSYDCTPLAPYDSVAHAIALLGDKHEGILYAFVELFSAYKAIVLLDRDYDGEDFAVTYMQDIVGGGESEPGLVRRLNRQEVHDLLNAKTPPYSKLQAELQRVLKIAGERQLEAHIADLTNRAIKQTLGRYPEGTPVTQQMMEDLIQVLTRDMEKLLVARLRAE